jgi:hypothetical protein
LLHRWGKGTHHSNRHFFVLQLSGRSLELSSLSSMTLRYSIYSHMRLMSWYMSNPDTTKYKSYLNLNLSILSFKVKYYDFRLSQERHGCIRRRMVIKAL